MRKKYIALISILSVFVIMAITAAILFFTKPPSTVEFDQALLEEMQHYKAHEKILIMATQVTYEGSSMDTYVVGRAAREQLPFLETYDWEPLSCR